MSKIGITFVVLVALSLMTLGILKLPPVWLFVPLALAFVGLITVIAIEAHRQNSNR